VPNFLSSFFEKFFSKDKIFKKIKEHKKRDLLLVKRAVRRKIPTLGQFFNISKILNKKEKVIYNFSFWLFIMSLVFFVYQGVLTYRIKIPDFGGSYSEAIVGRPNLINPLFESLNEVDSDISKLVYSGLFTYDKNRNIVPELTKSFIVSQDKKMYEIELKQGVLWHDSSEKFKHELTADDVVFTYETALNEVAQSPLYLNLMGLQVDKISTYTIRFTLKEPSNSFFSILTLGILPYHIWGEIDPSKIRFAKENIEPVGTGPYKASKFTKLDDGTISSYKLTAFPEFYGTKPYLQEINFQFFDSFDGDGGAVLALKEKRVDGIGFIPANFRNILDKDSFSVYTLQLPQYSALFFNNSDAKNTADLLLREALTKSIDKDRLIKNGLEEDVQSINGPILPFSKAFRNNLSALCSTTESNSLLDKNYKRITEEEYKETRLKELEAEYLEKKRAIQSFEISSSTNPLVLSPEDNEQIQESLKLEISKTQLFYRKNIKTNKVLTINLVTVDIPEYRLLSDLVSAMWQEVGVKTFVRFVDVKDFSKEVLKNNEYDALLYSVIVNQNEDQYSFWHSTQIEYPGLNLSKLRNKEVDSVLESLKSENDESKKIEKLQKFEDLILKEYSAVFLYNPIYKFTTLPKIKGISSFSIFRPSDRFNTIFEWYVKTRGVWKF
jgi:peptide/nickel transport system substrate-binding protein